MRAKIFKLWDDVPKGDKRVPLEDRVNSWLKSNEGIVTIEAVTTSNFLIIFYKKFTPNLLGR